MDDPNLSHGIGGYNRGCRCKDCRKAKSVKRKQYQSERARINEKRRAAYRRMTPGAKAKKSEYDRKYRKKNAKKLKAYERKRHLRRTFNLTSEEYAEMRKKQGGVCAICRKQGGMNNLAVDHDHNCCSGKKSCGDCVRGLLCQKCNAFLGRIDEDPVRLINYLKKGGF